MKEASLSRNVPEDAPENVWAAHCKGEFPPRKITYRGEGKDNLGFRPEAPIPEKLYKRHLRRERRAIVFAGFLGGLMLCIAFFAAFVVWAANNGMKLF